VVRKARAPKPRVTKTKLKSRKKAKKTVRRTSLPKVKPKARVKEPKEKPIGAVTHFFPKVDAAVIQVKRGPIHLMDVLSFRGPSTDFNQTIGSMQIDRKPIEVANSGQEIGVQVKDRVREGDLVFKVIGSSR